jgi:hypothetical protein
VTKLNLRSGGVINIIPKLPSADDEYTPEQRNVIDARLAEGLADITAGRVSGPFSTHKEFIASVHKTARKATRKQPKRFDHFDPPLLGQFISTPPPSRFP